VIGVKKIEPLLYTSLGHYCASLVIEGGLTKIYMKAKVINMALPYIVVNGRLTEDPIVKEINGDTVLNYRIAANSRKRNEEGEWVDAATTYLDGSLWGKGATNAKFKKGDTVIITGELRQRSYETKEGEKRTVYEIATESIGEAVKKY
jgi:single-strand DNA-binding protein